MKLDQSQKNSNYPFLALLVFIFAWFFADGVEFRTDSMVYLTQSADMLVSGEFDYSRYPFRGPVFQLLSSGVLWVADRNPYAVSLIPRVAGAAALLFAFMIVRRNFHDLAAFGVVAALATSSLFVQMAGTYHIDLVMTALLIASLYYLIDGLQKNQMLSLTISGILYALAFLTKELAILMAPLALISVLFSKTTVQRGKAIATYYLSVTTIVAPWAVFLISQGFNLRVMLGRHVDTTKNLESKFHIVTDRIDAAEVNYFNLTLEGVAGFSHWFFQSYSDLGATFTLVGFLITVVLALRTRRPACVVLALAPATFAIFVVYWGLTTISPRQLTAFACLLTLSTGPALALLFRKSGELLAERALKSGNSA